MNDLMGSIKVSCSSCTCLRRASRLQRSASSPRVVLQGGEKSTLNFQASDANRDVELGLPQPPEAPTEKAMDSFFKEVAQIKVC